MDSMNRDNMNRDNMSMNNMNIDNMNIENGFGNQKMQTMPAKKAFNRVAVGILIFLLVQSIAAFIISSTLSAVSFGFADSQIAFWLGTFLSFFISLVVFWAFLQTLPDFVPSEISFNSLSAVSFIKILFVCFGLMYAANYITSLLMLLVKSFTGNEINDVLGDLLSEDTINVFAMIYVIVLGPILEELAFRAVLFKKLAGYGAKPYMIFSSLIFAMFHLNFKQFFYTFVLGIVFAAIMYYTGKVIYSIILHILINFFGGGLPLFLLKAENELVSFAWIVITVLLMLVGLIMFFVWLKKYRSFKRREVIMQGEASFSLEQSDLNQKAKHSLPMPNFYKGDISPKIRETILTPGFIIFALIFIAAVFAISFLDIGNFL